MVVNSLTPLVKSHSAISFNTSVAYNVHTTKKEEKLEDERDKRWEI
jgi:hypothetical protein